MICAATMPDTHGRCFRIRFRICAVGVSGSSPASGVPIKLMGYLMDTLI
jgi:hypothetical protein